MGGLWVRLGKIKCAAKALASLSACSSFNFMKRWGFVCLFTAGFLSVVSSFRVRHNGYAYDQWRFAGYVPIHRCKTLCGVERLKQPLHPPLAICDVRFSCIYLNLKLEIFPEIHQRRFLNYSVFINDIISMFVS